MSTKTEVLFGAKRAGITWLFQFDDRKTFNRVQAGVKRLGMSLAEFLCRSQPGLTGAPDLPEEPRKFTEEDGETARLEVQVLGCDEFTRTCLERQAKNNGESVEEYISRAVFFQLSVDEGDAIVDAHTGDVVLNQCTIPMFETYKPDKGVPPRRNDWPNDWPRAVKRIPRGTIVEQCA